MRDDYDKKHQHVERLRKVFGQSVQHCRKSMRISQTTLAEGIDLTLDMVGRIERGVSSPSLETIGRLSEFLGVPVGVLFGGKLYDHGVASDRDKALEEIIDVLDDVKTEDLPWIRDVLISILKK